MSRFQHRHAPAIDIGNGNPRAIIRLHLDPEEAEALAGVLAQDDVGYDELIGAARDARRKLGEDEP